MKLFFSVFFFIATAITIPVNAQEYQGCFLIDENGNHVDLGTLCGGGSSSPQPSNGNPSPSSVPLEGFEIAIKRRDAGIPVVDVLFNGKHPFEMLVDTGASGIIITSKMAEVLGVTPHRQIPVETAAGLVTQEVALVDSVRLGSVAVDKIEVSIAPNMSIGLLGQAFFAKYDLTIKEKVIIFSPR